MFIVLPSAGSAQECLDEDLDSFECSSRLSDQEIKNMYEIGEKEEDQVPDGISRISIGDSIGNLQVSASCKTLKYKRPEKSYIKCSKKLSGIITKGQIGYIIDNNIVLSQVKVRGRLKGKKGVYAVSLNGQTTDFTRLSYRGLQVAFFSENKVVHDNYEKVSYGTNKTLTLAVGGATGQSFGQNLFLGQNLNPNYVISGYVLRLFLPYEHFGNFANYFGLRQASYSGDIDSFELGTVSESSQPFEGRFSYSAVDLLARIPIGPQKLFWLQVAHRVQSDYQASYEAVEPEGRSVDPAIGAFADSLFNVSWQEDLTSLSFFFEPNALMSLEFGLGISKGNKVKLDDSVSEAVEGSMDVQYSSLSSEFFLPSDLVNKYLQFGAHFGYQRMERGIVEEEKSKKTYTEDRIEVMLLLQSDF